MEVSGKAARVITYKAILETRDPQFLGVWQQLASLLEVQGNGRSFQNIQVTTRVERTIHVGARGDSGR
jgi:hypothetical protein